MLAEILPPHNLNLFGGERRHELRLHDVIEGVNKVVTAIGHRGELLRRVQAGQIEPGLAVLFVMTNGRHADHEELIQVRRSNRGEFQPLQQGRRRIARLVENPFD